MDTKRVLYFLNILNENTSDHSVELAQLYKRALDENDYIIHLKALLHDCEFFSEIGKSLFNRGTELLNKIYSTPNKAIDILVDIKQINETIDRMLKASDDLLCSPFPFTNEIIMLEKKDISVYKNVLKLIASTCVYLIVLYEGMNPVKNLTWNDNTGIRDMVYSVNTKYIPALCNAKRPNYSWVIMKKSMGGKALFGTDCFYLSYDNIRKVEVLCSALHKEPIGTHAFLNIDAYQSEKNDVPYCWGVGNIVSFHPDNALLFLQNKVTVGLRSPISNELNRKVPAPFECIKQLSDGMPFCISPDELVSALNQWYIGHEIEERKRTHRCLFCGNSVNANRTVCRSHFTTEL